MHVSGNLQYSSRCQGSNEWWPTEEKILSLPNTNKIHRQMQHIYIGYATETEIDNNGRIHLPPMLREYACMDRKAVMIGQGRRLEIWGEEIWRDKSSRKLLRKLMQMNCPKKLRACLSELATSGIRSQSMLRHSLSSQLAKSRCLAFALPSGGHA